MDIRSLRSLIIPALVILAALWVFNRPLSSVGLFIYRFTSAYFNVTFQNLQATQKDAADLLTAQRLANELEFENRILVLENEKLKAQTNKIIDLESALSFKKSFNYETIAATVIGRSPDNWHKQIILNKGSADGVVVGRGVLTEKGVIGQIQKTSPYSSIVQLVYNPDWRMGVKVARLGQYGVLTGNHPDPAFLQFITVDSDVRVGDEIVTSGICIDTDNCPYPENFPVARVISVEKDPNVVDLVVKVEFYEDLKTAKEIFVLK